MKKNNREHVIYIRRGRWSGKDSMRYRAFNGDPKPNKG